MHMALGVADNRLQVAAVQHIVGVRSTCRPTEASAHRDKTIGIAESCMKKANKAFPLPEHAILLFIAKSGFVRLEVCRRV